MLPFVPVRMDEDTLLATERTGGQHLHPSAFPLAPVKDTVLCSDMLPTSLSYITSNNMPLGHFLLFHSCLSQLIYDIPPTKIIPKILVLLFF